MSELDRHQEKSLMEISGQVISHGSKSFSLASRLFPMGKRQEVFLLYNWCRYCDDEVDESPASVRPARLRELKDLTEKAMQGEPTEILAMNAFSLVYRNYQWPKHYPRELLAGMQMDVDHQPCANMEELMLYSYRVAGVVGLMMAHIMGVSDEKALEYGCDMGMAMQLTNISRDVITDFENGRVYLPEDWLNEAGIPIASLNHSMYRQSLSEVVARLLGRAEELYTSGEKGLKYLDFRSALTIQSARNIYSEIGRLVLRKSARAWDERQYVKLPRKLVLVVKSFFQVLNIKLFHSSRGWRATPIKSVWRFQ